MFKVRCKACWRKELFWKLNKSGVCPQCVEKERKAREAEKQKMLARYEERQKEREAREQEQQRMQREREETAAELHKKLSESYTRIKRIDLMTGIVELQELILVAQQFCDIASSFCPTKEFEDVYWRACGEKPIRVGVSHPVFGYTFSDGIGRAIQSAGEKVCREIPHLKTVVCSTQTFLAKIDHTPAETLEVVPNSAQTEKPEPREFKINNITVRTARESLADFIVIDVETTGLQAGIDEIVQLSAVKYIGFQPVASICSYVRPRCKMSEKARAVNGITDEQLEDAPRIEEVMESFSAFLGKSLPLVGHNILFDLKFLHYAGCTALTGRRKYYDTLQLAKRVYKDSVYKLDWLVRDKLQIHADGAHDAKFDCFATGELFEFLTKMLLDE